MIKISEPDISDREINSVVNILKSGILAQNKKVEEFEENLAEYFKVDYAIAMSSGTAALHSALLACNILSGEVLTTPFSFIASSNAILFCNAKPEFVDIDETFNLNPEILEEKINKNTKAILPVHLYGQSCDMDKIMDIASKHKLKVIEDACQAIGAEFKNKKCGTFGDCGVLSFYATKNITTGEGGAVVTNDKKIMEICRKIRNHGQITPYSSSLLGYNYRMTEIEAAIGIEQLKRVDEINEKRIKNAEFLTKNLKNIVKTPKIFNNRKHVFHQYTILTEERDNLQKFLFKRRIETKVFYPIPIYKQPFYQNRGYKLPIAERVSKEVLSLPVHQKLTKENLALIVESIKDFFT